MKTNKTTKNFHKLLDFKSKGFRLEYHKNYGSNSKARVAQTLYFAGFNTKKKSEPIFSENEEEAVIYQRKPTALFVALSKNTNKTHGVVLVHEMGIYDLDKIAKLLLQIEKQPEELGFFLEPRAQGDLNKNRLCECCGKKQKSTHNMSIVELVWAKHRYTPKNIRLNISVVQRKIKWGFFYDNNGRVKINMCVDCSSAINKGKPLKVGESLIARLT